MKILVIAPFEEQFEDTPFSFSSSLSLMLNFLFLRREISLSGKFMETLNLDFANFCCLVRLLLSLLLPVFMEEVGCKGDCLSMLLGRSLADFARKLRLLLLWLSIDCLVITVSSLSKSRLADLFSDLGTAGAIENRAALKVAIRIDFSEPMFGWTTAEPFVVNSGPVPPSWDFESVFPNFFMTTLGLERRRMDHPRRRQRRRRRVFRSLNMFLEKLGYGRECGH